MSDNGIIAPVFHLQSRCALQRLAGFLLISFLLHWLLLETVWPQKSASIPAIGEPRLSVSLPTVRKTSESAPAQSINPVAGTPTMQNIERVLPARQRPTPEMSVSNPTQASEQDGVIRPMKSVQSAADPTPPQDPAVVRVKNPAILIRSQVLNAIGDYAAEAPSADDAAGEAFDPRLARRLQMARRKQLTYDDTPLQLDLTVMDAAEFMGYRRQTINGHCWQVPEESGFETLQWRIVMRDFGCDMDP